MWIVSRIRRRRGVEGEGSGVGKIYSMVFGWLSLRHGSKDIVATGLKCKPPEIKVGKPAMLKSRLRRGFYS